MMLFLLIKKIRNVLINNFSALKIIFKQSEKNI